MALDTNTLTKVTSVINSISKKEKLSIREIKGTASAKIVVDCEGVRSDARDAINMALKKEGIQTENVMVKGHSELGTSVKGANITILYKPKKGGVSETTLNSTITELFPCVAYLTDIKEKNVDEFYQKVIENNSPKLSCYLPGDAEKGKKFIDDAGGSSKFKEKVNNAMGILKFLDFQNKGKPISNVWWGYRAKPPGVSTNHPGDIFIKYNDNNLLGVSLKAGGATTMEPKLNTYVNPIIEFFGKQTEYERWKKESYDMFYVGVPNIPTFDKYGKAPFIPPLAELEKKNQKIYDDLYDRQLEWLRDKMIDLFNDDEKMTKKWLLDAVAKVQENVPLVVIKAVGDNYEELHDDDIIQACVQRSKANGGLKARKATTSKQTFYIDLTCNAKTTTLNFSIRTNKSGNEHKLGQFINLAVKFNGVEK